MFSHFYLRKRKMFLGLLIGLKYNRCYVERILRIITLLPLITVSLFPAYCNIISLQNVVLFATVTLMTLKQTIIVFVNIALTFFPQNKTKVIVLNIVCKQFKLASQCRFLLPLDCFLIISGLCSQVGFFL